MSKKKLETKKRMASRIQMWPIKKLEPYKKNSRVHSENQVKQIAASITEFGFNNPILIDSRNGVIAGHGRLLAAQELGLKNVPIIVLDHLSDIQKRAYIIADNKLSDNAGWDEDLLREELLDLKDLEFDMGLIGFSDDELAEILAGVSEPEAMRRLFSELQLRQLNPIE